MFESYLFLRIQPPSPHPTEKAKGNFSLLFFNTRLYLEQPPRFWSQPEIYIMFLKISKYLSNYISALITDRIKVK